MTEQQKPVERIKFNGHLYQIQRYPTGAIYVQDYPRSRGPKVAECLSDFRKHFNVPVFRALTDDERAQYVHDAVAMINNCMATFVSDDDLVKITGESNWLQLAPFVYFCSCGYAWRDCGGDEPGELECRQCGKRQHIKMHRLPNGIKRSHLGPGAGQMSYCSDCDRWTLNKMVNGRPVCACGNAKIDDGYNCTNCFYDQHAIIKYGPMVPNIGASMSVGGNPRDWTEHRLCLACGTEFEVEQSDY